MALLKTYNVGVVGDALETFGFTVKGAIEGLGLMTQGLIWKYRSIWSTTYDNDVVSTTWVSAESSITTTWTEVNL